MHPASRHSSGIAFEVAKKGGVRTTPMIKPHRHPMPKWQQYIKRLIDLIAAATGLVLLSPLMLYIALRVKASSKGPVLFRQERIGYRARPFIMLKFRSMYAEAEKDGPQLSSAGDRRVTAWGRTMRKWRLDELPQLWNVLTGSMSLVGPRPERKYYIDQMLEHYPRYSLFYTVKPGITSWGIVQVGYAETVMQMVARAHIDMFYVEQGSLLFDFKILLHTIRIVLKGKGK